MQYSKPRQSYSSKRTRERRPYRSNYQNVNREITRTNLREAPENNKEMYRENVYDRNDRRLQQSKQVEEENFQQPWYIQLFLAMDCAKLLSVDTQEKIEKELIHKSILELQKNEPKILERLHEMGEELEFAELKVNKIENERVQLNMKKNDPKQKKYISNTEIIKNKNALIQAFMELERAKKDYNDALQDHHDFLNAMSILKDSPSENMTQRTLDAANKVLGKLDKISTNKIMRERIKRKNKRDKQLFKIKQTNENLKSINEEDEFEDEETNALKKAEDYINRFDAIYEDNDLPKNNNAIMDEDLEDIVLEDEEQDIMDIYN